MKVHSFIKNTFIIQLSKDQFEKRTPYPNFAISREKK